MCFGLYTLFADRVGKTGTGLDGLALSVTVAALATSPVSISHAPHMSAAQWGIIAASAVLGVAIPYTMDTLSGRITSARVVGTLFSIDPAMSVIIAALILRQTITAVAVIGVIVACIVIIVREVSDTTVYLTEDVSGVTVLGEIPKIEVPEGRYVYWKLTEGRADRYGNPAVQEKRPPDNP